MSTTAAELDDDNVRDAPVMMKDEYRRFGSSKSTMSSSNNRQTRKKLSSSSCRRSAGSRSAHVSALEYDNWHDDDVGDPNHMPIKSKTFTHGESGDRRRDRRETLDYDDDGDLKERVQKTKEVSRKATQALGRSLATSEKMNEVARATMDELHAQGEVVSKIQNEIADLDAETKVAQKHLREMNRHWLLRCFCMGASYEEDAVSEKARRRTEATATAAAAAGGMAAHSANDDNNSGDDDGGGGGGAGYPSPAIVLVSKTIHDDGCIDDQMLAMHEDLHRDRVEGETILRKMTANLGQLKDMSRAMNGELDEQASRIGAMQDDASRLHDRVQHMSHTGKMARLHRNKKGKGKEKS